MNKPGLHSQSSELGCSFDSDCSPYWAQDSYTSDTYQPQQASQVLMVKKQTKVEYQRSVPAKPELGLVM